MVLVIAADESIKPQTREHFEICRLLGVKRGVVALTKSDLVDGETLGLVQLEVEDYLRGSFLENASGADATFRRDRGGIEVRETALLHQHLAVDHRGDDVRRASRVDEVPREVVARREARIAQVDHDEIRALADLEAAGFLIETQRAGAADRRHLERAPRRA